MKSTTTSKTILSALMLACCSIIGTAGMSAQSAAGPKVLSSDPPSGSKVESLSEIVLTMDQKTADAVNDWGLDCIELPAVFGASSDVKAVLWYPQGDLTKLRITIEPTLTADGTYEITIPAGYISSNDELYGEYNQEIKLVYTIGSGTSGDGPVQYDVTYTAIEPAPGTYEVLNTITLTFDTEVFTDPEARAYLYKDNMVYKGVPMTVRDGNKVDLLFENFDTEGVYELVIAKAQIGDEKWLNSHHLGHANLEFSIPGYKIKQIISRLTYDFTPTVTPDGTEAVGVIDRITLRFAGQWCSASEEQIAIRDYKDDVYPLTVSMGESLDEAILTLSSPLSEAGQYSLVIPQGRFGDSVFEETQGDEGALNPEITLTLDVDPSLSIENIADENIEVNVQGRVLNLRGHGNVSVYTVQGVSLTDVCLNGNTSMTLVPGIYIVRTGSAVVKAYVR